MADPISILGLVGTVDVCRKWGVKLVETCQAFRHAEAQLEETIVRLEVRWLRIEEQLQMVRKMEPLLDDRHREVQQRVLEVVLTKLKVAVSKLAGLIEEPNPAQGTLAKPQVKRLKYSFLKDSLEEAVSELERWQQIFDPSWYLMLGIADPRVDSLLEAVAKPQTGPLPKGLTAPLPAAQHMRRALNPSVADTSRPSTFLSPRGLVAGSIRPVPFAAASTALRADNQQRVLLDPVTCASRTSVNAMIRDIRNFARRLRHADPFTFGLFECKGILKNEEADEAAAGTAALPKSPSGLAFVFRLPPSHPHVESLRGRLLGGPDRVHSSLTDRFALARQTAVAVSYVHLYGYVHKNIRPETIFLCHPRPPETPGRRRLGKESLPTPSAAGLVAKRRLRDAPRHLQPGRLPARDRAVGELRRVRGRPRSLFRAFAGAGPGRTGRRHERHGAAQGSGAGPGPSPLVS
jgi:hypothetical protein